MNGVNKVILVGNLGADPEVRYLENDRAVATFSLATGETYTNKQGEKVTNTEWHNVVFWGPIVKRLIEPHLKKGNPVYIEGKLTTRSYDDKNGVRKYVTEVVGNTLNMLGGNRSNNNTVQNTSNNAQQPNNNYQGTPNKGNQYNAQGYPQNSPNYGYNTPQYSENDMDDIPF